MKKIFVIILVGLFIFSCNTEKKDSQKENLEKKTSIKPSETTKFPESIEIKGIKQNPEGIEFDKNDNTFLLSSLNATPIIKVNLDGTFKAFTSGEKFPLSTAGLQIDYKRNRLLVAGFNGTELMDKDPKTKGTAFLRVYNLKTGAIEKDINLSSLLPDANMYFANDVAIDDKGNAYITDWYANAIYKVDEEGNPSVFWKNNSSVKGGPNGIDFHKDGYLLVSLLNVSEKGLYTNYGLAKIPVKDANLSSIVNISNPKFTGFDGMVIKTNGNIVGVTNNGTSPGGNTLIELAGNNAWESADVINSKAINASTTVAVTPNDENFVINQDFSDNFKET